MYILDTNVLVAIYSRTDNRHNDVRVFLQAHPTDLIVSPYVVAEVDYLLTSRVGPRAARQALGDVVQSPYQHPGFSRDDFRAAIAVIDRYPDQEIGITDASLVVLASRHRTRDILTLDYRHFDVLRPLDGGRFRLMPRDWDEADA